MRVIRCHHCRIPWSSHDVLVNHVEMRHYPSLHLSISPGYCKLGGHWLTFVIISRVGLRQTYCDLLLAVDERRDYHCATYFHPYADDVAETCWSPSCRCCVPSKSFCQREGGGTRCTRVVLITRYGVCSIGAWVPLVSFAWSSLGFP